MKNHRHLSLLLLLGVCLSVTICPYQPSHSAEAGASEQGVPLDEASIRKDLAGRSLGDWTFDQRTVCRIKILQAEVERDKAVLNISIKAVKHVRRNPGWIGKGGELLLVYECRESEWNLKNVEATGLADLAPEDVYNVRKTEGCPLLVAVDEGDLEAVKTLLERGENIHQRARRGETALMIAAGRGHVHVSKLLLKQGLDVDMISADGLTALMIAARHRRTEMVEFLLSHGADINCRGPLGCTALLLALEKAPGQKMGSPVFSTAGALVNHGAHLNVKDGRGATPLLLAIQCAEDDVVELLLEKGADVNMRGAAAGFTPLMEAVNMGRPSVAKSLLERGADVHATANGSSALRLAKASDLKLDTKIELIQILRKAGARK
jgi:ankyrin repeat protein